MKPAQPQKTPLQERLRAALWSYGHCTPERLTAILTRNSDAPSNLRGLFPARDRVDVALPEIRKTLQAMRRDGQVLAKDGGYDLARTQGRLPRILRRRLKQAVPEADETTEEVKIRVTCELVLDAVNMHVTVWKERPTVAQVALTADLDVFTTTAALQQLISQGRMTGQELSYPRHTLRDRETEAHQERLILEEKLREKGLVRGCA